MNKSMQSRSQFNPADIEVSDSEEGSKTTLTNVPATIQNAEDDKQQTDMAPTRMSGFKSIVTGNPSKVDNRIQSATKIQSATTESAQYLVDEAITGAGSLVDMIEFTRALTMKAKLTERKVIQDDADTISLPDCQCVCHSTNEATGKVHQCECKNIYKKPNEEPETDKPESDLKRDRPVIAEMEAERETHTAGKVEPELPAPEPEIQEETTEEDPDKVIQELQVAAPEEQVETKNKTPEIVELSDEMPPEMEQATVVSGARVSIISQQEVELMLSEPIEMSKDRPATSRPPSGVLPTQQRICQCFLRRLEREFPLEKPVANDEMADEPAGTPNNTPRCSDNCRCSCHPKELQDEVEDQQRRSYPICLVACELHCPKPVSALSKTTTDGSSQATVYADDSKTQSKKVVKRVSMASDSESITAKTDLTNPAIDDGSSPKSGSKGNLFKRISSSFRRSQSKQ